MGKTLHGPTWLINIWNGGLRSGWERQLKNYYFLMKLFLKIPVLVCLLTGLTGSASAQPAVIPAMPTYQELPAAQLDQLLGPIALYPDPLIAQMLPASTLPSPAM